MTFMPQALTVQQGDTVVWRNEDPVPHTATAGSHFDTGQIAPGASRSWTVRGQGQVQYLCTDHPGMKATLIVR